MRRLESHLHMGSILAVLGALLPPREHPCNHAPREPAGQRQTLGQITTNAPGDMES